MLTSSPNWRVAIEIVLLQSGSKIRQTKKALSRVGQAIELNNVSLQINVDGRLNERDQIVEILLAQASRIGFAFHWSSDRKCVQC